MKKMKRIFAAVLLTAVYGGSALADDYNVSNGNVVITTSGPHTITGNTSTYTITVNSGITADITLDNVNIDVHNSDGACAFDIVTGATVALTLEGSNTLSSGGNKAGLQVPDGSTLEITAESTGSLTVTGGYNAAGIGSGDDQDAGTIIINGGNITANGGSGSAGIGSGDGSDATGNYGGRITINGGTVNAQGAWCGAGIGGGRNGGSADIIINGGIITANGGSYSPGIGGGDIGNIAAKVSGSGVNITITDATVTATGDSYGAGIGGGYYCGVGIITITGGTVIANGGGNDYYSGAAIGGGGPRQTQGSVEITGGDVTVNNYNGPTPNGNGSRIIDVTPGGIGVPIEGDIVISFSIGMNTTAGIVKLNDNTLTDDGTWSSDDKTFTIPYSDLDYSTEYTIHISGFESGYGVALAGNNTYSFTTIKGLITVFGVTATKVYDGKADFTEDNINIDNDNIKLNGKRNDDELILLKDGASGSLASADVVTNDATGTFSGFALSGSKAGNYVLAQPTVSASITKATLTKEHLDYVPPSNIDYDGYTHGIDTPALADPYTGLGEVTVKYNGLARLPDEPGTYLITVDIAEGANFTAVTDLLLVQFTILTQSPPPTIMRRIILPEVPGATTDPPAGTYPIISGSNFVFTLIPSDPSAGTPVVTSGREEEYNGDGSYTVRILQIRRNISIGITFNGANATTAIESTRVWSYGSKVYITAAQSGKARIYNLAGIRVKTLALPAGATVSETLAAGLYIVVIEGQTHKFSIKN
jgi:hypothetical protein